eukprot:CAMPEP_0174754786 /NCGR_PEP_ID=MMETSP1094-20130205/105915_1 /TAXON_ID=156173 /ORGANISM="Chrysochromulina brevifilum, Strain UTEX LB 985" /LENGTH=148 /DNA_ID=CAMNT_0015960669 /DNA_START=2237 /DNA_END=2685 /DNA_ORIENTATION=+
MSSPRDGIQACAFDRPRVCHRAVRAYEARVIAAAAGYVVGADGGAAITSDKLVTLLELPAERMKSRGEPPEVEAGSSRRCQAMWKKESRGWPPARIEPSRVQSRCVKVGRGASRCVKVRQGASRCVKVRQGGSRWVKSSQVKDGSWQA